MAVRNYSNIAAPQALTAAVNAGDTVLTVSSTAGYPTTNFILTLERGTTNEEVVLCTAKSGTTFTVTRGYDGTTAVAHAIGAAVEHTLAAVDLQELNNFMTSATVDIADLLAFRNLADAAGDLLAATANNTWARQPIGSNGQVFTVDTGAATRVGWATPQQFAFARKTADESVGNATIQNDDHLSFDIGASEVWEFDLVVVYGAHASFDLKHNFSAPAGATGMKSGIVLPVDAASIRDFSTYQGDLTTEGQAGGRGVASLVPLHLRCVVVNSSTAGTVQFRWAQVVADAGSATVVKANSYISARKVV